MTRLGRTILLLATATCALSLPHDNREVLMVLNTDLQWLSNTTTHAPTTIRNGDRWKLSRSKYDEIRDAIEQLLRDDDDDMAAKLIRLAWHSSATYDANGHPVGGACGATMRFDPEASYGENRGLAVARGVLSGIKNQFPEISYSDLWILAGYVGVEFLGGPHIDFVGGRPDHDASQTPPENRLPAWADDAGTIRNKMHHLGMDDRGITALMGGHSVGYTHQNDSAFPDFGHWDSTPTIFDNKYYSQLLRSSWIYDDVNYPPYYYSRSWIMLESDILLRDDDGFEKYTRQFADDEDAWFREFAKAFKSITELGL